MKNTGMQRAHKRRAKKTLSGQASARGRRKGEGWSHRVVELLIGCHGPSTAASKRRWPPVGMTTLERESKGARLGRRPLQGNETPKSGPGEPGPYKGTEKKGAPLNSKGAAPREKKELEVAADGFGVAGVEVGDEEEGDAEDDEGDEAVGALLAPDVEDDDFGDADEEEAEAGEAEAAFADDESEEEGGDGFDAPADGDATFGDFVEDEDGDENHGEEEIDLFGATEEIGKVDGESTGGRGLGARGGVAFAEGKSEG